MKPIAALCIIAGVALASCAKSSSSTPVSNASYQPVTTGSQWTYQVSENFTPSNSILLIEVENQLGVTFNAVDTTYTSTVTASGKDTVIGGLTYSILAGDTATSDVVIAQQGTNYYGIGVIPEFELSGVGGLVTSVPILYLKDTTVNATWTQTVIAAGNTDTTTYTMKITAVGGSHTVNGKTYANVTTETVSALPSGISALAAQAGVSPSTLAIQGTYYFARGVGLIELDINASLYGFAYTETLTSSTIQ
jgi:hypothetical protein